MHYSFFATEEEKVELWNWISKLDGMRLVEVASRPDKPNREFQIYPVQELAKPEADFWVAAWPTKALGEPRVRHTTFTEGTQKKLGAQGRNSLECPTLILMQQTDAPKPNWIGAAVLVYQTQKLAQSSRQYDLDRLSSIDWTEHRRTIEKIKKHIKSKSLSTWNRIPVSPGIALMIKEQGKLLWNWGPPGVV